MGPVDKIVGKILPNTPIQAIRHFIGITSLQMQACTAAASAATANRLKAIYMTESPEWGWGSW